VFGALWDALVAKERCPELIAQWEKEWKQAWCAFIDKCPVYGIKTMISDLMSTALRVANNKSTLNRNRRLAVSIDVGETIEIKENEFSIPTDICAKSDIVLISNNGADNGEPLRVNVHRTVCRLHGQYFRALFDVGLSDADSHELVIDCSPEALRVVVTWMYCGAARVSSEAIIDVLIASHMLQMNGLIYYIESTILCNADKETVLELLPIALNYGSKRLLSGLMVLFYVFHDSNIELAKKHLPSALCEQLEEMKPVYSKLMDNMFKFKPKLLSKYSFDCNLPFLATYQK